ncbi:ATP-binding protein [Dasania sp. GY-MA-18]|uniref:histidine kinase n=1 Tax=Dasania phycosphaerae TaxID=2950436 RepID=A0A9J6RML0_9GAMM|nr:MULTISPECIES: ATP-binding protein [Dasania]MCR8923276.1 ATP-binding protein [Dasania sp. GY-MA-18]MCZ0865708.1 ATP-binding protein [Dasania phycosphaerae]MCZ0869433.1 ATP-binding protein [Dasania phycosphaerae]
MKGLFIRLYILIIGCFLLNSFLNQYLLNTTYKNQFAKETTYYAETLAESLLREHKNSNTDLHELMQWWKQRSELNFYNIKHIEIVDISDQRLAPVTPLTHSRFLSLSISRFLDTAELAVPLKPIVERLNFPSHSLHSQKALLIQFHDAYDSYFKTSFYIGYAMIFIITASLVYLITYYLYRYLQALSKSVKSIAAGHYKTKAPTTSVAAFRLLSNDINTMSAKLQDDEIKQQIFNGAISHELRSPITRLRLALDILNASSDPDTIKAMGSEMDKALNDLDHLTTNVLQLSKAYLQNNSSSQKQISIRQVINNLLNNISDTRIQFHCQHDIVLTANNSLIETACANLINNACKYAKQCILIKLAKTEQAYQLTVEDDGIGIAEQERENIFQPFYRIDSSRSRQTGGSGLGLAIVLEIIRKTEGNIHVEVSPLGGAKFVISWPL